MNHWEPFFSLHICSLPDSPNGIQMLQTAGATESSVFLTESSVQTRLQELHSAHKGLTLSQGRHIQKLCLLDTDTKG